MSQKAQVVYSHVKINDTDLLKKQTDKAGGTMDRMWKYFQSNSRHVLLDRTPETFELFT